MQNTRQLESIQSTQQTRDDIEQVSTNQRGYLPEYERRSTNPNPNRRDAYVSDIVNVQSLLNIRAIQSKQLKRNNSKSFEDRIIINVCGDRYETHRTTLELYPETLLGNRKKRKYYFDKTHNEYFFDRNRTCFEAILYYYQSHGRLRRPNFVPIDIFLEEVTFFQLGQEALNQLREDENIREVKKVRLPKSRYRRYLWATMEYPDYSLLAKIVNILSLFMILVSTISLAIETLPQYAIMSKLDCKQTEHIFNNSLNTNLNNTNTTIEYKFDDGCISSGYLKSPFFFIQTISVSFFTIELILRLISTPSLLDFIKNFINWIDIAAVLPYYILVGIYAAGQQAQVNSATYIGLLRILRFIRIFKFYRVFKSIKSLHVLASTIKDSMPDFLIMIIILTLLSFLFGAAAYFAEHDTNNQAFDSIPKATYWGIITITSVGYGDISPITPIGRVIACLCSLVGAAMIGMLVSVLVDRYQRVFARKLYKKEEIIDFDDYSDQETIDTDSRSGSGQLRRRNNNSKEIEDPDARAKINAAFTPDDNNNADDDVIDTTDMLTKSNLQVIDENLMSRHSSRVHFIIGYVDDQRHETSQDFVNGINSIITEKQNVDENIQLTILSNDQQQLSSPENVQFRISMTSDDDTDDDDDNELTEIGAQRGGNNKGNVLKKFQSPSTPPTENKKHLNKSEKRV